jgi:hypothetical protein
MLCVQAIRHVVQAFGMPQVLWPVSACCQDWVCYGLRQSLK